MGSAIPPGLNDMESSSLEDAWEKEALSQSELSSTGAHVCEVSGTYKMYELQLLYSYQELAPLFKSLSV
jgi:hypothetical protein